MEVTKFINPAYTVPDYSTKFCRGYYNYLTRRYSRDIFYDVCKEMNVPADYLLADGNWISDKFLLEFVELLKQKTGNPNIAGDVGESFLHPDNINPFETALLKIMPPELFFWIFTFSAKKLNRRLLYLIKSFRPGRVVLQLHSLVADKHLPDICINMMGTLKGIRSFYKLNDYTAVHNTCIHRGDNECVFTIQYNSVGYWRGVFSRIGLILTVVVGLMVWVNHLSQDHERATFLVKILSLVSIALVMGIVFTFKRVFSIIRHHLVHYEQNESKERVLHENRVKLDRRYKESNMLRELSIRLIRETNSKDVVDLCLNELTSKFNYRRSLIMLVDSTQSKLQTSDVRGFEKYTEMLYKLTLKYPAEKENPQLFANVLEVGLVQLVEDIEFYKQNLTAENQILLTAFNVNSLIVAPIQDHNYKYGLLVIGAVGTDQKLNSDDKHLIENVANILSLFFQNAKNFEKERSLKEVFQKYVPAVVMDSIRMLEVGKNSLTSPKNNAITSMFIDLRGFTKVSEALAPEKVVEMLNLYIDHVTDVIAMYGGIVDNLVGDGIVAFFPATEEHRTLHAKQAMLCSIGILSEMDNLNLKLKERGFPDAKIGIGLHSGNATVGNVGGRVRVNYTAIGDTVNVAARLEALCKDFSRKSTSSGEGLIVFSEAVLTRAPLKHEPMHIGQMTVRGRDDALMIFAIDKTTAEKLNKTDSNLLFKQIKKKEDQIVDLDGERRNIITKKSLLNSSRKKRKSA